jgi:hypothetical protein
MDNEAITTPNSQITDFAHVEDMPIPVDSAPPTEGPRAAPIPNVYFEDPESTDGYNQFMRQRMKPLASTR